MAGNAEILDIAKWASSTAITIERVILKKQAPCLGFCLMFPVIDDKGQSKIDYHTSLAEDPHSPIPEEDRKRFIRGFEMVVEQVMHLFEGFDPEKKNFDA